MTTEKTAELHPDLEPKEDIVVPTGDEENPVSSVPQEEALKAIYKKSRKDRSIITRADEEENPDAEMISKMVAESADEEEFEHTKTVIDLDARKDHGKSEDDEEIDDPEYVENIDHERLAREQEDDEIIPEQEVKDESGAEKIEEIDQKPVKHLDYEVIDGKVKALVEGVEYLVPATDVESAGGIVQYQMNRAANIRFQKAATFGKALQKEKEELAKRPQPDSTAEGDLPAKDDLSKKAELVSSLREKLLDAALDGTEEDVDSVIEELLTAEKPEPKTQDSPVETGPAASDQVVAEYEAGYKLDRANANRMLATDYSDVMEDKDLRKIAHSKYLELQADPNSVGRTAVEMAREAGNFVRRLSKSPRTSTTTHDTELEARRVKKRVLPQGSEARTRHVPTETKKPRSNRDYIRELRRKQGNAS